MKLFDITSGMDARAIDFVGQIDIRIDCIYSSLLSCIPSREERSRLAFIGTKLLDEGIFVMAAKRIRDEMLCKTLAHTR